MTFREAYKNSSDWKRRINLISLYHYTRVHKSKDWKLTDSANYFGVSIGLISESLNLCKNWDVIRECNSRNEALKKVKSND
jgi:hypothetical protein